MSRTFPKLSEEPNEFGYYEIRWNEQRQGRWVRKRKSTKTAVRSEAESQLAYFLTVRDAADDQNDKTLAQVFEVYLRQHSLPRGNENSDRNNMRAPLLCFGDHPAVSITDSDVEAYALRRARGGYGPKKVVSSTIRRELVAMQAVLNFGSRKGLIRGKPTYRFEKPSERAPRDRWLTEEDQEVVLEHLQRQPLTVRIFVRLALTYAVRKGAIMDLRFGDQINFVSGTIDFNVPGRRQTRKRRPTVPMTRTVRADLEAMYLEKGRGRRVCDPATPDKLERFLAGIGYEWVTPHVFKHSAITLMLRAGVKQEDVCKLTATDLRTIMKHYRHHTVEELTNIAEGRGI